MKTTVHSLVPRMLLDSGSLEGRVRLAWKFVVLETADGLHLVTGPIDHYPYHANLIAEFCEANEIPSSWVKAPDLLEVFDPGVRISGGGHLRIDLDQNKMKLYGRSTAYGDFDRAEVSQAVDSDLFFNGYSVEIVGN